MWDKYNNPIRAPTLFILMKKSWSDHNAQTNSSLVSISSSVVSNSSRSTLPSRRWLLVSGPGFLASSMMASTSSILWETYSSAFLTPFSFSFPSLISFTWAFRVHACFSISWIVIRCEYHKQTSITNYILKLMIKKKKNRILWPLQGRLRIFVRGDGCIL